MTIPALIYAFIISSLTGLLFHLMRGGSLLRLLLYLFLSWSGFAAGHLFGTSRGWVLFPFGPLNLGMALIGSLLFLGIGYWLSLIEILKPGGRDDRV